MISKDSPVEGDESLVAGALRRQSNLLSSLVFTINKLNERFNSALRPPIPEGDTNKGSKALSSSPLCDAIEVNNEELGDAIARLDRIIDRSTI